MKKRTALIFYVLSVYVVIQFVWWGYHMIELTRELGNQSNHINKRVVMILGEGAVFLLILMIGIWQIRRSIRKDLKLSERQNNFLLSVTHELKTPLAANKLYLQTAIKRDLKKEHVDQLLEKAIEENDRLERMIDNILNASRLENKALQLSKEQFDIYPLAEQLKNRFQHLYKEANIQLDIADHSLVFADKILIETILSNLVENALKYAGSTVPITIYASRSETHTTFGVRDLGDGIPPNEQGAIFEKFYRVGNEDTRTQKGSGLGLFIVSELIKLHGGTISYTPNTPKGANFQILLRND